MIIYERSSIYIYIFTIVLNFKNINILKIFYKYPDSNVFSQLILIIFFYILIFKLLFQITTQYIIIILFLKIFFILKISLY